jgi:hypothetical protein
MPCVPPCSWNKVLCAFRSAWAPCCWTFLVHAYACVFVLMWFGVRVFHSMYVDTCVCMVDSGFWLCTCAFFTYVMQVAKLGDRTRHSWQWEEHRYILTPNCRFRCRRICNKTVCAYVMKTMWGQLPCIAACVSHLSSWTQFKTCMFVPGACITILSMVITTVNLPIYQQGYRETQPAVVNIWLCMLLTVCA